MSETGLTRPRTFAEFSREDDRRARASLEEKNRRLADALAQARERLVEMHKVLDGCSRPPASLVPLIDLDTEAGEAEVWWGGKRMRIALSGEASAETLRVGDFVRVSETMVATSTGGPIDVGEIVTVREVLPDGRVLVQSGQMTSLVLRLAHRLVGAVGPGDSLIALVGAGLAVERVERQDVEQLLTPEVPRVSYNDIGGLRDQIEQVRDAVELPFCHPDLYRSYGLEAARGILLYGPPGCGKTLIAKAIATSLGGDQGAYFLSVKGPELLSKFVGETERQIRQIFARARDLADANHPVVVFFDEMEALFRTRGSGVSSDVETTVVPQLLAEMDGVDALSNVIIIGASNREDMIDPALLRAGRLDVRIRLDRPDRRAGREIVGIHLGDNVPLCDDLVATHAGRRGAAEFLADLITDAVWRDDETTAVFRLTYASGAIATVHLGEVASGAMLAGIVERAKTLAIKDHLAGRARGLQADHCLRAVAEEVKETATLAAAADPGQWSRNLGYRGDTVVSVCPAGGTD